MAFTLNTFNKVSTGANSRCFNIYSYLTTDNRATVEGTGYFNAANDGYTGNGRLALNDWIAVQCSDASVMYYVGTLTPNIVLTAITFEGAGSIVLSMLATAIAPSHVVKAAGTFTTLGGDANESITVSGVLTTDNIDVSVSTAGATPRSIVSARCAVNGTIAVVLSGDPSTDHILSYRVLRATS